MLGRAFGDGDEMAFLEEIHKEAVPHEKNNFTGIFENLRSSFYGKN